MKQLKDIYSRLNADNVGALGLDSEPDGERYTSEPDKSESTPSNGANPLDYRVNSDNIYDFSAPTDKKNNNHQGGNTESFYTDTTGYYTEPSKSQQYTSSPDMGSSGTYNAGQYQAPSQNAEFTPPDAGVQNASNSEGTTGFVLSLIGLVVNCCCGGGFVIGLVCCIIGIVLCVSSKKKAGQFSGLALAGLICGIVGIATAVLSAIAMVFMIVMNILENGEMMY